MISTNIVILEDLRFQARNLCKGFHSLFFPRSMLWTRCQIYYSLHCCFSRRTDNSILSCTEWWNTVCGNLILCTWNCNRGSHYEGKWTPPFSTLAELTTMDRKVTRVSLQMAPCCRRLSEDLELSDVLQANKVTRRKPLVEKVTNAAFTCEKQVSTFSLVSHTLNPK